MGVLCSAETQGKTDEYISTWLKQQKREDIVLATKVGCRKDHKSLFFPATILQHCPSSICSLALRHRSHQAEFSFTSHGTRSLMMTTSGDHGHSCGARWPGTATSI